MTEEEKLDDREKVETLLPHFLLAGVFIVFLVLNFLYYRRNNVQKYQRKIEKRAQEMLSVTPRRITSMMRYSDFVFPKFQATGNDDEGTETFGTSVDFGGIGKDCSSSTPPRKQSLTSKGSNSDEHKSRQRYSLPPLMFAASASAAGGNKRNREMV